MNSIAQYPVKFANQGEKTLQVMDIELAVGVHKKGQVFGDSLKAAHEGRAVAPIHWVMNDSQAGMYFRNGIQNDACAVPAAVIDDDDFEVLHPCC